jgi:hypothetical protein
VTPVLTQPPTAENRKPITDHAVHELKAWSVIGFRFSAVG